MFTSIEGTASRIAAKQVSPLEVTEACLARIDRLDGDLQAFLYVDAEGALDAARRATEEVARAGPSGPLHGIPIAVKDLIDVTGMPTTAASKVVSRIPDQDAPAVASLRKAGAIVLGKTNLDPFAYGVFSEPTRNPWDHGRIAGGSSGGSAVAVASRMSLGALGTDTAGSIRIPASFCGIAGLKPRSAEVPSDGIVALSPSLDSCGPMASSVADLRLLWQGLTGAPAGDPRSGARVGMVAQDRLGDIDPAVSSSYADALALLGRSELELVEVDLPDFEAWRRPASYLLISEALQVHRAAGWYPDREELYDEVVLGNLRYAEGLSPERLADETRPLEALRIAFQDALEGVTALLLPTTPLRAPELAGVSSDPGLRREIVADVSRFARPVNCCAAAAVTVPWALVDGLPIGMDVVAHDERTALEMGAYLEFLGPGVGFPPVG